MDNPDLRGHSVVKDATFVITQSGHRGKTLVDQLHQMGICATHAPLIVTSEYDIERIGQVFTTLHQQLPNGIDGYVFTSATAARVFVKLVQKCPDWLWGHLVCYCIGEATAQACRAAGFKTVVYPSVCDAISFADAIAEDVTVDKHLVFVRGEKARPTMPLKLAELGYGMAELVVYDTVANQAIDLQCYRVKERVIWVMFSPSGVDALLHHLPDFRELVFARAHDVIPFGRTTKSRLEELNIPVATVPMASNHEALIQTIQSFLENI